MNAKKIVFALSIGILLTSCTSSTNELSLLESKPVVKDSVKPEIEDEGKFEYVIDQFADLRVLRYRVPEFEKLPLKTKELLYYLYEAALCGRDITWDQNYKYNLSIRKILEAVISKSKPDAAANDEYKKFLVYAKRVWFSNGIHHHYNNDKIIPECSQQFFKSLILSCDPKQMPLSQGESLENFSNFIIPIIYEPFIAGKSKSRF